jgi:acylglycerol lipase
MIHGIGEHSGRYLGIGKMLADNDFAVYMIDLTGYGCSGGGIACGTFI